MNLNTPIRENIKHYLRDTFRLPFAIVECDDAGVETPVSLVGAGVKMEVRGKRSKTLFATISTANGRITFPTGAASGEGIAQLNPVDATELNNEEEKVFDMQFTMSDGYVFTAVYGDFQTIQDVTTV